MPTSSEHVLQAKQNLALLNFLKSNAVQKDFSDWVVTVSFYTAVHIVEAFIYLTEQFNIGNGTTVKIKHSDKAKRYYQTQSPHVTRIKLIKDNEAIFNNCYDEYVNLYELSRIARYNCEFPYPFNCADAQNCLMKVYESCKSVIGTLD